MIQYSSIIGLTLETALLSHPLLGICQTDMASPLKRSRGSSVMFPGEELTYEVRWWKFKLGQIRFRTLESMPEGTDSCYRAVGVIDSYDLPFVDLHVIDTTVMDKHLNSVGYHFLERKDDQWFSERSTFDRTHQPGLG